jgi:hypothetical protein
MPRRKNISGTARERRARQTRGRARNLSERRHSAKSKALHVLSDLRRDTNLTLTQAAKNREVSLRSIRKHIGSQLKQDRPGGRIRVTPSDRLRWTMSIPSTKPDVRMSIHTKNSKERYVVGEWFAAINEARDGDFTRINKFPKGTRVDGVRLPTGTHEVQRILEAMENSEQPFEDLYAMAGAA